MRQRFFFLKISVPLVLLTVAAISNAQKGTEKFPVEQGYFTGADGIRLFYRKLGIGHDLVVFLHGGPGLSICDVGYSMRPLADDHTLITYDQRGGGAPIL